MKTPSKFNGLFGARGIARPNPKRLFWLVLGALGLWLGFANNFLEAPPAVLLWPTALTALAQTSPNGRSALKTGWLCSFSGGLAALYWLAYPVHFVGGLHWLPALACAALITACLSTQGAIFCLTAWRIRATSPWLWPLNLAILWYLLEYAYAVVCGFPWLTLSGALAAWPILIQAADLLGAYAISALWLCACLYCLAFLRRGAGKNALPSLAPAIMILCALLAYGSWQLEAKPLDTMPEGADAVNAVFIEGNVDQNQKWEPSFQNQTLDLYLNLSSHGLAIARSQGMEQPLLIWPETALPFFFETRPTLAGEVRQCAAHNDCPLLFGAPGIEKLSDAPEGAVFNRAFLIGPDGKILGHYDKEHLVPFGEYLPQWLDFPFLRALLQGVGVYREGTATKPLRFGSLALGMLICYEGIFPWLADARVTDGANILVDISNDGWFGRSPAARQHLYLTVARCLEQNRWLLRATNTGISAVADPRGRLVMTGPQFQAGWLLARARIATETTIYHKLAPWLPLAALLACMALLAAPRLRQAHWNWKHK